MLLRDRFNDVTQNMSNKITQLTQDFSDDAGYIVKNTEDTVIEMFDGTSDWVVDKLTDMAETMSLGHGLMQSMEQDRLSLEEERLQKYGDPSESIKEEDEPSFEDRFMR